MTFTKYISGTLPHHGKFSSRNGAKISRLIVHHWAGVTGGDARLISTSRDTPSANYIIYSDGRIIGQVPEEYRAWTSGAHATDAPSITVEVQNSANGDNWPVSQKAFEALTVLLADLANRYKLDLTKPGTCIGHRDVYPTACPGDFLYSRLGELRSRALAIASGKKVAAAKPQNSKKDKTGVEDEMKNVGIYYTEGKTTICALLNPVSGFWSEYSTDAAGKYNNPIAAAFGTGNFAQVTKSHFDVLRRDIAAVRAKESK